MKGKGPITWKSFALIATAGLGGLGFMWYVKDEKEQGEWELGFGGIICLTDFGCFFLQL